MKISPIINYSKQINFKGEIDKEQPLNKEMREIFADSSIPKYQKKILWGLSEIPHFCEASAYTPKEDLLELTDRISKSKTNILEMALKGDIKISFLENGDFKLHNLLPLDIIAKRIREPFFPLGKNLLEIIKKFPLLKIEENTQKIYSDINIYPHNIILNEDGSCEIAETRYAGSDDNLKLLEILARKFANEEEIKGNEEIIIFDKQIKGKKDYILQYSPLPKKYWGQEITQTPEKVKELLRNEEIKKSLFSMSETPYFNNLIKDTPKDKISLLAQINKTHNNMLTKMLKQEITLDVLDFKGEKIINLPIIDVGKILLNQRMEMYPSNDLFKIIDEYTPAFALCAMHSLFSSLLEGSKIKSFILEKEKDDMAIYIKSEKSGKNFLHIIKMAEDGEIAKKFMPILSKAPYKKALISFEKE